MGCGCQGGNAQTYRYTDSTGNVYTGTQIEMRAQQIRDQRATNTSGKLEVLTPASTNG